MKKVIFNSSLKKRNNLQKIKFGAANELPTNSTHIHVRLKLRRAFEKLNRLVKNSVSCPY